MTNKFLVTVGLIVGVVLASALIRDLVSRLLGNRDKDRSGFWTGQLVSLLALVAIVVGLLLIWFDDPRRLTGALGLAAAGVAVALQRVITAFAGYLIILRGNLFTVGDRIVMDAVRGDVVSLGFMQTTVMEMGQSPAESAAAPAVWVGGRQYTGRVVRITNDKIFDSPVFNYTREFPFVWEEIRIPIHFDADRNAAERILLEIARKHTSGFEKEAIPALEKLRKSFHLSGEIETAPRVFYRVTDNWVELALRFVAPEPGVRRLKDAMYRDLLDEFERLKLTIASTTMEVSLTSPVHLEGANLARQ
ncbi:MAG: mechanosensitive ion channel domain-containing protein [Gemmatimonadaceae bacterium]